LFSQQIDDERQREKIERLKQKEVGRKRGSDSKEDILLFKTKRATLVDSYVPSRLKEQERSGRGKADRDSKSSETERSRSEKVRKCENVRGEEQSGATDSEAEKTLKRQRDGTIVKTPQKNQTGESSEENGEMESGNEHSDDGNNENSNNNKRVKREDNESENSVS
jgi:hypothetical protein